MKSFCIKTNNTQILDYLQNKIADFPLTHVYFSRNNFKIYKNIIIHYSGNKYNLFINTFCDILSSCISNFFTPVIINRIINYNYFYFDEYEKNIIKQNCINTLNDNSSEFFIRKELLWISIFDYFSENKTMILDGFVNFRIADYKNCLDNIVDINVRQYVIDKEYFEFINLLKIYLESKPSTFNLVHLLYFNNHPIILDEFENLISVDCSDIVNKTYLSDISFSSCDYILNTLLTISPQKIIIHMSSEQDDFINTLKLIFEKKVCICSDCNICKTYSLLNKL